MSELMNNQTPYLPSQKKTYGQKTEAWFKENIDGGVQFAEYDQEDSLRSSKAEKVSNINLFNDISDPKEVEAAVNPYNYDADFPSEYRNYPIVNSNLNLLFGEERKRYFNPVAYIINNDIKDGRTDEVTERFRQFLKETILAEEYDQKQAEEELQKMDKWKKFTFQDSFERTVNQILRYFLHGTDIKEHFSRNFEDLLIQGEELGRVEVFGGKLRFRRVNPLDIYTLRVENSWKVEDSVLIVEESYIPIPNVIDEYHDYLKASDLTKLEEENSSRTAPSSLFKDGQLLNDDYDNVNDRLQAVGIDGNLHELNNGVKASRGNHDDNGNIKVTKVLWKGMRKIGTLEYHDEEGNLQKKTVDERWKADKDAGEDIKWKWISEWNEGTKIGGDIYVKYGPLEVQFRDPENPSICYPPFVGNILNTGSSRAKSLMSYMKPFQLQYNFFAYRLQQDFIKFKGHIASLDLSQMPDGWTVEKLMYYIDTHGVMPRDPFNEGQEGAATGKLAGHMNQSSGSTQIGDFNLIQANMMMMELLRKEMDEMSGVSPQRKGAVQNRETKGGVERSVMQSSNNTEKYYGIHDDYKLRVLQMLVQMALFEWKDSNFKKTFVLDDNTKEVIDFIGEDMLNIGAIGVSASNSSEVMQGMNAMREIAQAYMQNGGRMSEVIDVYTTKDPASLRRRIEQYEDDRAQKEDEMAKRQEQIQKEQIASAERQRAEDREHEILLEELKINGELQKEAMKLSGEDDSLELEKLRINEEKIKDELKFKDKALNETKRHNIETEKISRIKKPTK